MTLKTARSCRLVFGGASSGQSLIETALILPFLLMILLNAINFGYFFLVAINLTSAPRSGVEYSILGYETPAQLSFAPAGPSSLATSTSYLTYQDMTGALYSPANTPVQVCASVNGLNNPGLATQASKCTAYGNAATFPAPAPDPESPSFVLARVDVVYKFSPLIPGTPFNIVLLASPICTSSGGTVTCSFHRQASMREM